MNQSPKIIETNQIEPDQQEGIKEIKEITDPKDQKEIKEVKEVKELNDQNAVEGEVIELNKDDNKEINLKIEKIAKEATEQQQQFEQKWTKLIQEITKEIYQYKIQLDQMKQKYNSMYEEMINNQIEFTKEEGEKIFQQHKIEIETKMKDMNTEFNEKARTLQNQLRMITTQLNFSELHEMKTKIFDMRNKLIEFEQLFIDLEKRSSELKTKQIQLNQQSCYYLSRKKINEDILVNILKCIEENNYMDMESIYCRFTYNFFTCGLSIMNYLEIIDVCLKHVNEFSSKIIFEIVINSLEYFAESFKKQQSIDEMIELQKDKVKSIVQFMSDFIVSPLAIHLPNSVTAYRISKDLEKQLFSE